MVWMGLDGTSGMSPGDNQRARSIIEGTVAARGIAGSAAAASPRGIDFGDSLRQAMSTLDSAADTAPARTHRPAIEAAPDHGADRHHQQPTSPAPAAHAQHDHGDHGHAHAPPAASHAHHDHAAHQPSLPAASSVPMGMPSAMPAGANQYGGAAGYDAANPYGADLSGVVADPANAYGAGGLTADSPYNVNASSMQMWQAAMSQGQPGAGTGAAATSPYGAPAANGYGLPPTNPYGMQQQGAGQVAGARSMQSPFIKGDLEGMNPQLQQRLEALGQQLGTQINIISGHRSTAEQQQLYDQYLAGTGNLAARPGTSRHESGNAADAYIDGVALANVPGARAAAERLGLGFPVSGEAWHVEATD